MQYLSAEDQAFLAIYRVTSRKRALGMAQKWELGWLVRHAALAHELASREQSAKAA